MTVNGTISKYWKQVVFLGSCIWWVAATQASTDAKLTAVHSNQIVFAEIVKEIQKEINEIKLVGMDDRFRSKDALKLEARLYAEITILREKIIVLENRKGNN